MSVNEIVSRSTTRVVASPYQSGSEGKTGVGHAYAVRGLDIDAWAAFVVLPGVSRWDWTVRLEDATVFSSQADARLAAQNYFPLDRTEVVRVNLPLRSPVRGGGSGGPVPVPTDLSFSRN